MKKSHISTQDKKAQTSMRNLKKGKKQLWVEPTVKMRAAS